MIKFLELIGYNSDLESKDKFTYIINGISIGMVASFLIIYIALVKSTLVNIITVICLIDLIGVFALLKFHWNSLAKVMMILGFLFQEFSLVFIFFPKETNLNFFYFIVAPISFFIYDFDIKSERIAIIAANLAAIIFLVLSETTRFFAPLIPLDQSVLNFISIMSTLFTIFSISIVFYFYASNLSRTHQILNSLADTDSLTKITNRRFLFREGDKLFKDRRKNKGTFTFLIFDIDFFKKINDTFGHPAGDSILRQIALLISGSIRNDDLFSRYGGEEFALILRNTSQDTNVMIAHKLKDLVNDHQFAVRGHDNISISISIGVVSYSNRFKDFDDMVQKADTALYMAKEKGRNCVVVMN